MKQEIKKRAYIVLIIITIFFVYWRWFLPFPHVASDLHVTFNEALLEQMNLPYTWGSEGAVGLGEYSVSVLWTWPVDLILGALGNLGYSHNFLNQFFVVLTTLVIGAFSVWKLLDYLGFKNTLPKLISSLFYMTNSYILLIIDGGQLAVGLAYAWLPVSFLSTLKALNSGLRGKIISGAAITALGFFDIRFVYVLFVLLLLKFLYVLFLERREFIKITKSWASTAFVIGIVFVGLHAYWLYPALKVQAPTLPETYQRQAQVSFLSFAELGHGLFLQQPHWFKNVFGKVSELRSEFVLIPILVFLAPVLRRKSKFVGFWLLVALVGVFLVKGANPPLPGVYPWLFANVPGFSLFRDPTKFFFLVALSYSVLIGVTTDELVKRFNWSLVIGHWSFKVIPLLLIVYFLLLISPVYTGRMTGTFSEPVYKNEFFKVADILQKDSSFGRVFWIPTKAPLGYSSPNHPSVEASRLVQKRPFAIGTVGTYEVFNFLREAPFMGEIFKIAGIDYIAYPFPDTRREELKEDNIAYYHAFLDQLTNLPWISGRLTEPPVSFLRAKEDADHFFVAPRTFCIVGSDRIYWNLTEIPGFDLSQNALIFLEENAGLGQRVKDVPCTYILFEKDELDLAATFIDKTRMIFPAEQLDFSPSTSSGQVGWPASRSLGEGWWKRETADFLWWRNFLQTKYAVDNLDFDYGGGWAVAEDNRQLTINHPTPLRLRGTGQPSTIDNVLLARVMESSRGGRIEVYQGEEKIGEIDTLLEEPEEVEIKLTGYQEIPDQIFEYDKAMVRWFEVGKLAFNHQPLTIKTSGDINVVNALATVPEDEWQRIHELMYELNILDWESLTEWQKQGVFGTDSGYGGEGAIDHTRISPTHYKLKVQGLKGPVTLAFSETYDPLWEANGQASYPLYGLINGFRVDKDGEYDITFSAQRYVLPGLSITGTTLLLIIFLLFRHLKRKTP